MARFMVRLEWTQGANVEVEARTAEEAAFQVFADMDEEMIYPQNDMLYPEYAVKKIWEVSEVKA